MPNSIFTIIKLISFLIHLLLGSYVFLKSSKSKTNQSFSMLNFSIAIIEFGYFMYFLNTNQKFWIPIMIVGQCLLPGNIVYFSLTYGRYNYENHLKRRRIYLFIVYSISLIFLVAFLSNIINYSSLYESQEHEPLFTGGVRLFILFSFLTNLSALINLESTYRLLKQNQKQLTYPIILFMGMLVFHLLAYSLALGFHYTHIDILAANSIVLIAANSFMAYQITKSESYRLGIYVRRTIIAKSYTMLLTGIYLVVIGMLGKIIQIIGQNVNFLLAFLVAFVVLLLLILIILSKSLKMRFQSFIERNFYENKYDYRTEWENFSQRIFSILNIKELVQEILEAVSKALIVDNAFIMLLNERKNEFFVAAPEINDRLEQYSLPANDNFIDWLWRYGHPVIIDNGKCKADKSFSNLPNIPEIILNLTQQKAKENGHKTMEINVCVPIAAEGKLVALIVISRTKDVQYRKNRDQTYSQEDISLLEIMANQISIAITNAKKNQELALIKELESFNKISMLILHDLKGSASMLSLVVQNAVANFNNPEFQKDALSTISNVVNRIQKLIIRLSSISKEIESQNLQPANLNEVIKKAIVISGVKNISRIRFVEKYDSLPEVMLDAENIERLIINLILNSVEAISDDGVINIETLNTNKGYVLVSISDTGCGMSQDFIRNNLFQPFQTTKSKGLGIGLYQCKAIIDAHNGTIDVQSQPGSGSTFTIKLPLAASRQF